MTLCYHPAELADITRRHCLDMLKAGRGIHAYVLHKADALEAEAPDVYEGLVGAIEKAIGAAGVRVARRDIGILLGTSRR